MGYSYSHTEISVTPARLFHRQLFFAANERKSVEIGPLSATLPV